jgi:hypothetical protein
VDAGERGAAADVRLVRGVRGRSVGYWIRVILG